MKIVVSGIFSQFSRIELKKMIESIKNCELKNSANKIVFSDGNLNSKIMFIGEGPGAQEDQEGLPFVGRAGKLLDKMLEAINLNRKKIYISIRKDHFIS